MKTSEFRKLIREEVRRVLNEDPRFDPSPLKNLANRPADMAARAKAKAMRGIGNVGQTMTTSKLDPNATYKVDIITSRGDFDPGKVKKASGQPSMVAKAALKKATNDAEDPEFAEEFIRGFKLDEHTYYILTGEEDVVLVGSPKSKKYGEFWSMLVSDDLDGAAEIFDRMDIDSVKAPELKEVRKALKEVGDSSAGAYPVQGLQSVIGRLKKEIAQDKKDTR